MLSGVDTSETHLDSEVQKLSLSLNCILVAEPVS